MANKSIGQFISALRKANGMTQQQVADRLNVSNKAVSRWERDECSPDITLIPALAELLGVTCDELLKGERIIEPVEHEKISQKTEKQVASLINRAVSNFKTMIWISLALSAVGVICMFGISYGFYRPVIGFFVMLLFLAAAVVTAVIAVNRLKEISNDNELFENAGEKLTVKYNKILGSFSFTAFFAVISAVAVSMPLIIHSDSFYIDSVLTVGEYIRLYFVGIVCLLALVYLFGRDRYSERITGVPCVGEKMKLGRTNMMMTALQTGFTVVAGAIFVLSPYAETSDFSSPVPVILSIAGLVMLAANIICFAVFVLKFRDERKSLLLTGIRNMMFIGSALLIFEWHEVSFTTYDKVITESTFYYREDSWNPEFLIYSLTFTVFVIVIFKVIGILISKRKNGDE